MPRLSRLKILANKKQIEVLLCGSINFLQAAVLQADAN